MQGFAAVALLLRHGIGFCVSVIAHALCFALFLNFGQARFLEERSAGAPDQVWGKTSSIGVETFPIQMVESAANSANETKEPPKEIPQETLKEVVTPTEVEAITHSEQTTETEKPFQITEFPELAVPQVSIIEPPETLIPEVKSEVVEVKEAKEIEEAKSPPPPPQEVASVAQSASGGPVGQAAGKEGSRSETSGDADISSYSGVVVAHLRRFKRYPAEAQRARVEGTVRLAFRVGEQGEVLEARIVSSSGSKLLDDEAMAMVSRAQPFPALPTSLNRSALSFSVPVSFQR